MTTTSSVEAKWVPPHNVVECATAGSGDAGGAAAAALLLFPFGDRVHLASEFGEDSRYFFCPLRQRGARQHEPQLPRRFPPALRGVLKGLRPALRARARGEADDAQLCVVLPDVFGPCARMGRLQGRSALYTAAVAVASSASASSAAAAADAQEQEQAASASASASASAAAAPASTLTEFERLALARWERERKRGCGRRPRPPPPPAPSAVAHHFPPLPPAGRLWPAALKSAWGELVRGGGWSVRLWWTCWLRVPHPLRAGLGRGDRRHLHRRCGRRKDESCRKGVLLVLVRCQGPSCPFLRLRSLAMGPPAHPPFTAVVSEDIATANAETAGRHGGGGSGVWSGARGRAQGAAAPRGRGRLCHGGGGCRGGGRRRREARYAADGWTRGRRRRWG
jgi:hypothetical protein